MKACPLQFYIFSLCLIFRVLLDRELSTYPGLMDFCQQLYDDRYRSPYLIACMIDAHEEMLENNNCDREHTLMKAVEVKI